jgi:hypothetical protein
MIIRALFGLALPAAALFALEAPAAAQSSSQDPAASTRRICRVTPTIGSRLGGTRTCRTKAEWDAADRENREAVSRYQRTTSACMMGPNDPRLGGGPHLVCSN